MKNTLRIALLSTLFLTNAFADDGQQGTGGRTCPPECTIEAPENCPPGCGPTGTGGRTAPEGETNPIVVEAIKQLVRAYFARGQA